MLENLTKTFSSLVSKVTLRKTLTRENIEESLRSIRMALIEADVNLTVIKQFLAEIKEIALGKSVVKGVTPADAFVKTVHDGLIRLLGGPYDADSVPSEGIHLRAPTQLTSVLVSGLQGSGKTTTIGKLACHYKKIRDVLLVSLDTSRPAAALQLQKLALQAGVAYFDRGAETNPLKIINHARKYAKKHSHNVIFYDTAGRTQLDTAMLTELKAIYKACDVDESLFVLDAMLGQRALKVAEAFKATIPLDSLLFTKFDSDTSGGAVLSVKYTINIPIAFIGVGEKIDQIERFDPVRVAKRILGMGDVVALVEKAEQAIDAKTSEKLAHKIAKNQFDLEDMLTQLRQMNKMGSLKSIAAMIPGMGSQLQQLQQSASATTPDKEIVHTRAVIESMTSKERAKPFLLNNSRKLRIAKGSGTTIIKVNQTLKKFQQMKTMMKKMSHPTKSKKFLADLQNQLGGQFPSQLPSLAAGNNPHLSDFNAATSGESILDSLKKQ
ncbi:signal recognition particle protein [Spirochaetota bacterium]|nr:signal recognition particle protein [Spirochaetota bacterium]